LVEFFKERKGDFDFDLRNAKSHNSNEENDKSFKKKIKGIIEDKPFQKIGSKSPIW